MLQWLLDTSTMAVGVLCVVMFLYGLVSQVRQRRDTGAERRDPQRFERRREDQGAPYGIERRSNRARRHEDAAF